MDTQDSLLELKNHLFCWELKELHAKPAETWEGNDKLVVQGQTGNTYIDVDLLDTNIYLKYKDKDVGDDSYKISKSSFNNTGFSWSSFSSQQNKWFFNSSKESWVSNYTTNGGEVDMDFSSSDGNAAGSIKSRLKGYYRTATTTWTSPNFTWTGGAPGSAELSFHWKVDTINSANGFYYVLLVKPDGTASTIYPLTAFSSPSNWATKSNSSVSVNDFSQSGNYRLKLVAILTTYYNYMSTPEAKVRWDNPAITLSTGSELSEKSLFDITRHYFSEMAEDGDIEFYQGYRNGKGIKSESSVLVNYTSINAPIYMYLSENLANVSIR